MVRVGDQIVHSAFKDRQGIVEQVGDRACLVQWTAGPYEGITEWIWGDALAINPEFHPETTEYYAAITEN